MADVSLDNLNKKLLIAGVPISVTGGIADGDGVTITPDGPRRVAVRGLYGDGVWVKQMNAGHWQIVVNALETSEMNTILYQANLADLVLPLYYEVGATIRSGTGMVMTDPTLKVSNTVAVHTYMIETFNFLGSLTGRTA